MTIGGSETADRDGSSSRRSWPPAPWWPAASWAVRSFRSHSARARWGWSGPCTTICWRSRTGSADPAVAGRERLARQLELPQLRGAVRPHRRAPSRPEPSHSRWSERTATSTSTSTSSGR